MTAKSAIEMMLPQVMRALGLDPDKTKETIEGVGNAVVEIRDRLARIEQKLDIAIGGTADGNGTTRHSRDADPDPRRIDEQR